MSQADPLRSRWARGTSNAKARRELGWRPRYPSWRRVRAGPRLTAGRFARPRRGKPGPVRQTEEGDMALDDRSRGRARNKTRNKTQELKGQFKEAGGRASGNPRLEAEGRADRTRANLKQAAEKIKDAFRPRR
jgi:uncharacterized protein YjbJ (UPF0337 family)